MEVKNKTLKFNAELVPLVLEGTKTSTWRIGDDKDLKTGDIISFIKRPQLTQFAQAELTSVIEKPLGKLTNEEKDGHEIYESEEQMYQTFSDCYKMPVDANTLVKIIKFRLI